MTESTVASSGGSDRTSPLSGLGCPAGAVDPDVLYEAPYTDLDPSGLGGLFTDEQEREILTILAGMTPEAAPRPRPD
jgi:hypothetical protein